MTAAEIARALGVARGSAGTYLVPCVAHEDSTPSLALRDGDGGRVLARCHAGCAQDAVVAALRARGLWHAGEHVTPDPRRLELDRAARRTEDRERTEAALRIWESTRRGAGSLVATYLRSRSISSAVPERLRFAVLKHPSGERWPCMVALVTDVGDRPIGVHRTYLARDGGGKASVKPAKMSLGPIAGGAVRLARAARELVVAEGIETALAASELSEVPAWAALSAPGVQRLELPQLVRSVLIAADRDEPGRAAALAAAERWLLEGRSVRVLQPPAPFKDFADQLAAQRRAGVELAS